MKLEDARLVVLDTETCNIEDPKLIEIAGLKWSFNRDMKVDDFKENYVNPGCKIDPSSMAIHHILDEYVEDAPFIDEIDEEWGEWVGDDIIVAYNSDFDKGVLKNTSLNDKQWLDAYRMAMHFWSYGQVNEDGFALGSFKQQELRYWLKIPKTSGDAHRAAADIQVTAHIIQRAMEIYLEQTQVNDFKSFIDYVNGPILHETIPVGGKNFNGKIPEEINDKDLKLAFWDKFYMYDAFEKFDIHKCLIPEYIKRFGHNPLGKQTTPKAKTTTQKSFSPDKKSLEKAFPPSSSQNKQNDGKIVDKQYKPTGRWVRGR